MERLAGSKNKYFKLLSSYWLLVTVCFFIYLGLSSVHQSLSFRELLTENGTFAVGLLLVCLLVIQLFILVSVGQDENNHYRNGLLGHFLLFVLGQQLLSFNLIGVVISFYYYRSLPTTQMKKVKYPLFLILGMACIGFLTLIILLINTQLFF